MERGEERWKRTTVLRARKSVIRSRRVADAENIHHARGALSPPVDLRFIITFSPARTVPPPSSAPIPGTSSLAPPYHEIHPGSPPLVRAPIKRKNASRLASSTRSFSIDFHLILINGS